MNKCPKCLIVMTPMLARVILKYGDTLLETIGDAHHCDKCGHNYAKIEAKVIPIITAKIDKDATISKELSS